MNHAEFRRAITDIYAIIRKLEGMFEGRPFTSAVTERPKLPPSNFLGILGTGPA